MWYVYAASLLFLPFYLHAALGLLILALLLAAYDQILQWPAIAALAAIGAVAIWRRRRSPPGFVALSGEVILVLSALALMLHLIPGFANPKIVSAVRVGPESAPFTFYYNFDKALIPFLLIACMPGLLKRPAVAPKNRLWWLVLMLSLPLLLLVATLAGGLRVELHRPAWLGSFMLANLFFVSFAEEALFRGYLQQRLSQKLGNSWGLGVAAVVFGLAHIAGGPLLVLFAALAGIIYGLAWLWSGRVWVSTLVHFACNMLHLLFFTYPIWQRLP